MGHYNSFLIKVWTDDGQKLVRGHVQHVGTEEIIHFNKWEKMVDFIVNHLSWHISEHLYDEANKASSEVPQGDQ